MVGCLVVAFIVFLLFLNVPWPFWPLLIVGLVVLLMVAVALGLLKGFFATIFRR